MLGDMETGCLAVFGDKISDHCCHFLFTGNTIHVCNRP